MSKSPRTQDYPTANRPTKDVGLGPDVRSVRASTAVNGGTEQLFQQLVFRLVPGFGRPETPIGNLYLGSAAAHPGGGVHGVCGFLAARAALGEHGWAGGLRRRVTSAGLDLVHGPPAS